ncbi:ATP12 family chaperone protein [Alsobacter ponti]
MKDEIIISDWFGAGENRPDPHKSIRMEAKAALPRRFYKEAGVAATPTGFVLTLDGRPARTPARSPLETPAQAATQAVADEWAAQGDVIDPASMPFTKLVNTALDGVARQREAVVDEIARYAGSDLLCYRAGDPARLVERESAHWDPVLAWARDELGARFVLAEGVMFASQPDASLEAVREAVAAVVSPLALAGLSTITSLTGSVLLALAVARGRLTPEQAWTAAHVDEDFQMELWGYDDEALERRARRWREMDAAARLVAMVG